MTQLKEWSRELILGKHGHFCYPFHSQEVEAAGCKHVSWFPSIGSGKLSSLTGN
ncbi:MAG: hypothetical protein Q4A15_11525 [Prevotellaceae bacterium]|nr:hypothetical protein [Prevotellaceae bacterium]